MTHASGTVSMTTISNWTLSRLRKARPLEEETYLQEAAVSLRNDARSLSIAKFDKVVFQFALDVGVMKAKPGIEELWIVALKSAVAAIADRYAGIEGEEAAYSGLYMFWECVIADDRNMAKDSQCRAAVIDLMENELRSGNDLRVAAAIHGISHVDPSTRRQLLGPLVGQRQDSLGRLAKAALEGKFI